MHESTWGDGIDYSDDYTYDFRGNRTRRIHQDNTSSTTETTDYTYNSINQLTSQTNGTDTVNYTYDIVGNMTSVAKNGTTEKAYTYDPFNRLSTAIVGGINSSYTYNGDNLRQTKTVNGVTTNHIYDGAYIIADTTGTTTTVFVRGVDLALLKNGTTTQVYGITPRGDVAQLMTPNGTTTAYTYTAYGEPTSANSSIYNPFGYTGEYTDLSSGLIYLRNRYYDPSIGRFITEDPARDGLNWYAYCGDNPVMFVDPWGLKEKGELIGYGSNNSTDVLRIQKFLNSKGYYGENGDRLDEDAIFGSNTIFAVKSYQADYGLSVDGIVGDETWSSMGFTYENIADYVVAKNNKPNFTSKKDQGNSRKGSENRQKTGARERQVGHPDGEEHSRVPKGNNGIRRSITSTVTRGLMIAGGIGIIVGTIAEDIGTYGAGISNDIETIQQGFFQIQQAIK